MVVEQVSFPEQTTATDNSVSVGCLCFRFLLELPVGTLRWLVELCESILFVLQHLSAPLKAFLNWLQLKEI